MDRSFRWLGRGLLLAGVTAAAPGCDPASLSYFLFRGDQRAPAEAKAFEAKRDKREVVVAVLVTAPTNSVSYAGLDRDIVGALGRVFEEQTKDKKPLVKVVSVAKLDKFKTTHPGWKSMAAAEIGKELGADYAIEMTITQFNLYDAATGREMYMGRATADVKTYDTATGDEFSQYFVEAPIESKMADSMSAGQYKTQLVQRLALRTSWKHIPHVTDQRVSAVQ